jgi:hypothetical protein
MNGSYRRLVAQAAEGVGESLDIRKVRTLNEHFKSRGEAAIFAPHGYAEPRVMDVTGVLRPKLAGPGPLTAPLLPFSCPMTAYPTNCDCATVSAEHRKHGDNRRQQLI